ncbi:MAG TPA: DUF1501 domain-containing protein [Solirubrobacterales bacterium]|nr:DUF1501 domain-containing protein [Solirubrobacterales bacterium]
MSADGHNCCRNYTRSQLLRSAAAEAGKGLPAVEPGMPVPAGTGLTRRKFLSRSAGLALAVYGASKLPIAAFEDGIAQAAGNNRVLVSIFLDGGADALSLLAPVGDPLYASLRPTLALAPDQGTAFSEDTRLRWHPAAAGLATLHGEGKVSAFPAIGYTSPNQSHFTSRHFWEIGEVEVGFRTGWLGRYLDLAGDNENPLQGLSLDGSLSPALATASKPVAAVDSVTDYDFWARVDDPVTDEMFSSFGRFGAFAADSAPMTQTRKAIARAEKLRRDLRQFDDFSSPVPYPNGSFAERLAGLAALLGEGMPLHCVTVSAPGGYDTHSDQAEDFDRNIRRTCDAVLAFQRDLEARGLADRVLIEMWSEFGRRPEENGSAGTDHGAAGAAFVIGSRARGQMVGEYPGLAALDEDDNVRATSDFRGMYCALLEEWLGHDAGAIIPGASAFARPALVR